MKKTSYDLSTLNWKLSGWIPYIWRLNQTMEVGAMPNADVPAVPARIPGSVQQALKEQGILTDWNMGTNFRQCEWVENRHWIYEAQLPDEWLKQDGDCWLKCDGLDYRGWVFLNGTEIGEFEGSFVPHEFNLTEHLQTDGNLLRIVFDVSPRWLGQFGYTSRMTDWKVRFNYTWDWTVRLVQVGIWEPVTLEFRDGHNLENMRAWTDASLEDVTGSLRVLGSIPSPEGLTVQAGIANGSVVRTQEISAEDFNANGIDWKGLPVDLWWPNMHGEQPLYMLRITLHDSQGNLQDKYERRVGFRNISWQQCEDAPEGADPWICTVNGRAVFMQGANWTPILPNFADVTRDQYRQRLELYRDLGFNIMRVWGGAFLERECFYDLCDELGIMVWQEFPLSSSGRENLPPGDPKSIDDHEKIARSYISRRQHHASLIIWCGGNELHEETGPPCDLSYPLLKRHSEVVNEMDPTRRYLPTSSSGPTFYADPAKFGEGIHWDVHGPWKTEESMEVWQDYWNRDDALLRSEMGSPGTSSAEIIRQYAGQCEVLPIDPANPLWRRTSVWWIETPIFIQEMGREPESLEEYVAWSQERQKQLLSVAARACKSKFPRCAGIIFWMGHDCFPCTANTAIIDFHGHPKPAAEAIGEIFRADQDVRA